MLLHQTPIESALIKALPDHLNAEIVNGTVNNLKEAMSWLSYTFLFVRMCKNPLAYGIEYETVYSDPTLELKRKELILSAINILDTTLMCRYEKYSGNLGITNQGRIASYYYLKYTTIEGFNTMLAPHISNSDALHVLCSSSEFDSLKIRPEELSDLELLRKTLLGCSNYTTTSSGNSNSSSSSSRGSNNNNSIFSSTNSFPIDTTPDKVHILLLSYLHRLPINSFTLQADINYITQNSSRITRALFEITLKRGWVKLTNFYLTLYKCIDRRTLDYYTPLRQFHELNINIIEIIEKKQLIKEKIQDLTSKEIGEIIKNPKFGSKILQLTQNLPDLSLITTIQPITKTIIKLNINYNINFLWNDKYHSGIQGFYLFIEDSYNEYIYHTEHILIHKSDLNYNNTTINNNKKKEIEIILPMTEPIPNEYYIRITSDTFINCNKIITIPLKTIILPTTTTIHSNLLPIHPISIKSLQNLSYELIYKEKISYFNPIQSQLFYLLYKTFQNLLVCAPTGSGKTIIAELAILHLHTTRPKAKTIYIAPLKSLARERLTDWSSKFNGNKFQDGVHSVRMNILELTGDHTPTLQELNRADILIVTPEKWDSISRGWMLRSYVRSVQLVVIDEIHLLGVDRGPVLVSIEWVYSV